MTEKLLLVDDDEDILSGYQRNLRKYFNITVASSPELGLKEIKDTGPYAVVVSDYNMPLMNGIEFLSKVRELTPDSVRIMITGFADLEIAINAVNEGNVFRFLTKPIETLQLVRILNECISQYMLVISEKELLEKTLKGSIKILIDILTIINPETFSRANRYRRLARHIAQNMNYKNMWEVEIASLLSQIGVIAIPQEIVDKYHKKEKLDETELSILGQIPKNSHDLIKNIPRLEDIALGILYQGTEYNSQLTKSDKFKGKNLPLISRILKVVVDYDYQCNTSKSGREILNMMKKHSDTYDIDVINALESTLPEDEYSRKTKAIAFKQLRIAMELAEDIFDDQGNMLIPKGREITDVIIMRLMNIARVHKIVEPLVVYE